LTPAAHHEYKDGNQTATPACFFQAKRRFVARWKSILKTIAEHEQLLPLAIG
jgi:hypothetical protein